MPAYARRRPHRFPPPRPAYVTRPGRRCRPFPPPRRADATCPRRTAAARLSRVAVGFLPTPAECPVVHLDPVVVPGGREHLPSRRRVGELADHRRAQPL